MQYFVKSMVILLHIELIANEAPQRLQAFNPLLSLSSRHAFAAFAFASSHVIEIQKNSFEMSLLASYHSIICEQTAAVSACSSSFFIATMQTRPLGQRHRKTSSEPPVEASSHGSPPRSSAESHAIASIQSNAPSDLSLQLLPQAASQPTSRSAVTVQETSASAINPAPEVLEPIKPRDWSFVEEEQARKQASGAIKRRKDPLQKSDISAGGRLPSIDHSALYSGGNLCMMLSTKDKVQAQRVLDALRELHARKGRRGNTGDLMEKHHLTSHIYFGNLSTQVLQSYCSRYRLATPTHSSHERLADAVARHFNAVEPPLETDVLTNVIHHKPASAL
jgi:hypothetical protein